MNEDLPPRPANVMEIVAINQGKEPYTWDDPEPVPLGAPEVRAHASDGAVILDTRGEAAFGAGHICGALNIQLTSPEFEQRVGWITPVGTPLVLVLDADSDAQPALHKLAFLGLDGRVLGFLRGGIRAWIHGGESIHTMVQHSVHQLHAELEEGVPMHVLDVRETSEWDAGHIASAHHQSFKQLDGLVAELPFGRQDTVAIVCGGGLRSSTGASILLRHGFEKVYNITGGMGAWKAAGLPTV